MLLGTTSQEGIQFVYGAFTSNMSAVQYEAVRVA
jgi:hypothetical protein